MAFASRAERTQARDARFAQEERCEGFVVMRDLGDVGEGVERAFGLGARDVRDLVDAVDEAIAALTEDLVHALDVVVESAQRCDACVLNECGDA